MSEGIPDFLSHHQKVGRGKPKKNWGNKNCTKTQASVGVRITKRCVILRIRRTLPKIATKRRRTDTADPKKDTRPKDILNPNRGKTWRGSTKKTATSLSGGKYVERNDRGDVGYRRGGRGTPPPNKYGKENTRRRRTRRAKGPGGKKESGPPWENGCAGPQKVRQKEGEQREPCCTNQGDWPGRVDNLIVQTKKEGQREQ